SLLGKTGTAVRFEGGRYVQGEYTASFAALFPAENPQLVVVVKIDNPTGQYYGGLTAAPVTRTMLQQALALRRVAIDRNRLAPRDTSAPPPGRAVVTPVVPPVVLSWPYQPDRLEAPTTAVPDVTGRPVREAALALHRRGFRVSLRGLGQVSRTAPDGGEFATPGTAVAVWAE
ncbi:MAG: penicillin-binding transpeptidase domain-containing protein, partial [Gemmatimonadota bacterium]|nr:penicillin-binding transpeptidase domain-containing protein [Gemmatimonadota bacterium]